MEEKNDKTVGDYVAEDYRTAKVFEKYGIDFCCGGKIPLSEACREKGIDPAPLRGEIEAATSEPLDRSQNFAAWGLPFLADYIVTTHHGYLNENTRQIAVYAHKIAEVHGAAHPEVVEIARIFDRIAADMEAHLREEEEVLFPAIKRIDTARKGGGEPETEDLALLRASLDKLDQEHDAIGEAVHAIRDLSKDYAIPDNVCNTFMVAYRKLKEFEDDLHKHVHLENNILFPKAAQL
ncbi:iron-sulfur cluster repair di-iron protein [Geobacter sp. SVR]|uniref:iron-sulfur cluster repair di-iron protein n=1 Tax=Geobacter sp. SVR TaxID=2495594 RepID=UPI00143EFD6B|nr:iron-sulfur cluster repair di-iron protein [Geobacter sp. SVR]BCS55365.1 iron-sulfur cluster repair di-iron protein [Geobacter sp. SVR]GCF87290.1 iron-sulfur cluster repair di-iron protein [Geobacter sp. SVR]